MGGTLKASLTVAAAIAILAALPAGASAQGGGEGTAENHIPWPSALPGLDAGAPGPPPKVRGCREVRPKCVRRLLQRMRAEWRADDAACDHRAIFSLGYLRISREIKRRLRAHTTFRFRRWFISVVQGFSNLYFSTQRRYDNGKQVPGSWRIYYEAMDSGDWNAGQDLLLASNAHTNHDLPYAYAAMGMITRRKQLSRKPDHDNVNDVNAAIYRPLAEYYADNYDPFFSLTNTAYPFDQLSMGQIIQGWREDAWRQGERLLNASSEAERQQVQAEIEEKSTRYAEQITLSSEPGHRQVRDAYCRGRQQR